MQNVVTYDTVIEVNNDELKLKPGMTANVSISIAQRENAVKLPNAALRFRPPDAAKSGAPATPRKAGPPRERAPSPGRSVYVLHDGKPEPVQVKLGISDGIFTEVVGGLKENDVIVTGMVLPQSTPPGQPSGNPFSGGRRF